MAFIIDRIVGQADLLKRPRVSYKISEYIFEFINDQILKPANILQSDKYIYEWTLSFSFKIPVNHKILYKSPYSTGTRLYVPHKGFRTFEKITKNAHLSVVADDINQDIMPEDYALVVYNMIADYLLYNYKKLKKEHSTSRRKGLIFQKSNLSHILHHLRIKNIFWMGAGTYWAGTRTMQQKKTRYGLHLQLTIKGIMDFDKRGS